MWNFKLAVVLLCSVLISIAFALPVEKENDADSVELAKPVIVEAIEFAPVNETPAEVKPVETSPVNEKATETSKPSEIIESSSTSTSISTTVAPTTPTSAEPTKRTPPRRQYHYDQRQDGKYNIRADLENFVILVVPSSGNSLLDLLRRSNQRPQHQKRTHNNKHHSHKKYYGSEDKTHDLPIKKHASRLDYLRPDSADLIDTPVGGEFIEGRTPYHVDISSSEISPPTLDAVQQNIRSNIPTLLRSLLTEPATIADIPLGADPSLVEAESTIFLPAIKGNQNGRNLPIQTMTIYPRYRKSLTTDDLRTTINTNSVLLTPIRNDNLHVNGNVNDNNNNNNNHNNNININNDDGDDANNNNNNDGVVVDATEILMRPEFIDLTDTKNSFDSLNVGNIDRLALSSDAKLANNNQWELTLLGAQEQCGPDRRRDSYGICQFVPHDYAT